MGSTLHLTEMPINAALWLVSRELDHGFATEMTQLEQDLIRDNVNRESIDGLLDHKRERFLSWRAQELIELRDWLVDCNRKLH